MSILEDKIYKISNDILKLLLIDKTTNNNILWCTDNYNKFGSGYYFNNKIEVNLLYGRKGRIIMPRMKKNNNDKKMRIKQKAEVFTPSWACNHQNNLVDELWFGEKNIFNIETMEGWITNENKIQFKKRTWQEYIFDLRLEITCGEAPYVVSRYDAVTGQYISPSNRIGILDRKIRVINENVNDKDEWFEWIKKAYQSVYGYEWQGDNLFIARENLLYSFIDYYLEKFNENPSEDKLVEISKIIVWNFWQMDGLKGIIPMSCENSKIAQLSLFGDSATNKCIGCETQNIWNHNGIYCKIKDWKNNRIVKFINIIPRGNI